MTCFVIPKRSRGSLVGIIALALVTVMQSQPGSAQDFGDTPYVQTPQNVVDRMLQVAKVHQVVCEGVQDVIWIERWDLLGAVPFAVAVSNYHG